MSETPTPIEQEAAGKTTATVTWRDFEPFEVPIYRDDWSFEAVLAAESGEHGLLLVHLLPDDALQLFRARRPKPTLRDVKSLLDAIADAMGLANSGESPASAS